MTRKTFIYGFIYGAGDRKIGEIVKGSSKEGRALKARFLKQVPALNHLREAVQDKVIRTGKLKGIDGRILNVRSQPLNQHVYC